MIECQGCATRSLGEGDVKGAEKVPDTLLCSSCHRRTREARSFPG
jgi:hypothetical protein